jgi:hypothetical protein
LKAFLIIFCPARTEILPGLVLGLRCTFMSRVISESNARTIVIILRAMVIICLHAGYLDKRWYVAR